MTKTIKENASSTATHAGSIAFISTSLNPRPIKRQQQKTQDPHKYSNTPNFQVYNSKGDKSVSR